MKNRFKNSVYLLVILVLSVTVSCKKNKDNSYNSLPSVTTNQVTSITFTTAECTGTITLDGGYAITQRGMCWSTKNDPTLQDSLTKDGEGAGLFTSKIANLLPGTKYYLRAYATNYEGTSYGSIMIFTTEAYIVKDIENNVYKTVQIGNQVWMAENLKVTKLNDNTTIPLVTNTDTWVKLSTPGYCWYNNDEATYKDPYGALYNWYTVNTKKLCPSGWHMPTLNEWNALSTFLSGGEGDKLRETGTVHWHSPNESATNEFGFTGLPGGFRGGVFTELGTYGYLWSSTEYEAGSAYSLILHNEDSGLIPSDDNKVNGYSIRCVRD